MSIDFLRKEENFFIYLQRRSPYRDRQRDEPRFLCAGCGEEQYEYDREEAGRLCSRCAKEKKRREENAMTLREMSVEYRAQAAALRTRMRELEQAAGQTEDPEERARLEGRVCLLASMWRETRDLAVLLERYYERGYRRNGRYTL